MTEREREKWLEERQTGIGSSDAADIVCRGFGGNDGPGRVYRSKVEPVNPVLPRSGVLRRGIDMEPIAAALYEELMDRRLSSVPLVRHATQPVLFASNDRTRDDGIKVEIKTVASFNQDWGDPGTDEIPERYRLQCQHQMNVTGAPYMDLFALSVTSYEGRIYRLDAEPDVQNWLADRSVLFWSRHVQPRHAPGDDWLVEIKDAPVTLVGTDGITTLGDEWASLCEMRKQALLDRDAADAEVKQLTEQIRAAVRGHKVATTGRWTIRRVDVPGRHVAYDAEPYSYLTFRNR